MAVDSAQEQLQKHKFDIEAVKRDLMAARGVTRRQLNTKPTDMSLIMTGIEGLED